MKYTALILVLLISFSYAYVKMTHSNGKDVLDELQGGNHNTYVILFVAGATEGTGLANRNNDYEENLIKKVLNSYEKFHYTKIDARDKNYDSLIKATGISVGELQKAPSILIMEHGNGSWIHGPEAISKISEYAQVYNKRSSSA